MARTSDLQKSIAVASDGKPQPPSDMTEAEKAEWNAVFDAVKSDFIPTETYPILAQYCRHIVRSRLYSAKLSELEASLDYSNADDLKLLDRLSGVVEREHRSALANARSLRLTSQSLRTADISPGSRTALPKRPWEA